MVVTGESQDGTTLSSRRVQVFVGGNSESGIEITCMNMISRQLNHYVDCTDIPAPVGVRAEVTANNASIKVSWQWSRQGMPMCVDLVGVHYQTEGDSLMI